jgi:hypothetical protein
MAMSVCASKSSLSNTLSLLVYPHTFDVVVAVQTLIHNPVHIAISLIIPMKITSN